MPEKGAIDGCPKRGYRWMPEKGYRWVPEKGYASDHADGSECLGPCRRLLMPRSTPTALDASEHADGFNASDHADGS